MQVRDFLDIFGPTLHTHEPRCHSLCLFAQKYTSRDVISGGMFVSCAHISQHASVPVKKSRVGSSDYANGRLNAVKQRWAGPNFAGLLGNHVLWLKSTNETMRISSSHRKNKNINKSTEGPKKAKVTLSRHTPFL